MTTEGQWQAPSPQGDGREARQRPEETAERLLTWWQRALRWIAWLTFLGLAVWNARSVSGVRLKSKVSAEFFRRLLAGRGFTVDSQSAGSSFTARRK